MYYSNDEIEEFDRYAEFLGYSTNNDIENAPFIYINLENFIFEKNQNMSYANHVFTAQELNDKFNKLLIHLNNYEKNHPKNKQYRFLNINLVDVKSQVEEDMFKWSYYNHKFAASQGKDTRAMNEWHKLEQSISAARRARFKAMREANMAHYLHIIKNHMFFDSVNFTSIHPQIINEIKFGIDIAEEQYLEKLIKDNKASSRCRKINYGLGSLTLNMIKRFSLTKKFELKGHIASSSKKLNPNLLVMVRNLFAFMTVKESSLVDCDFILLVNDLDQLSVIPMIDSDQPIFAVDLSQSSTPNFSYMLLKDEGFSQVFSYAKKKPDETIMNTIIRSFTCGLMSFILNRKFTEQIALNYMDDYFNPLSKALNKNIAEFAMPIKLLTEKLEREGHNN